MSRLDKDERTLLQEVERGKWRRIRRFRPERERYEQLAKEHFKKDQRVNIRISSADLRALKVRALEEGVPYQTLLSSILHRYVSHGLGE